MHNRLYDIGDQILRAIQASRTPLTDALLRVLLFFAVSAIVLAVIERIFEMVWKKGGRSEADRHSLRFIFIMLNYLVLIIALYLTLRAIVTELTATEASGIQDVILWLHKDTQTVTEYGIKYLVALVIFIIFHAIQSGFFKVLKNHLIEKNVSEHFVNVLTNVVKYILLSFLIIASALQIMITGGNSVIALIIYAYLCVTIAVPFRQISQRISDSGKTVQYLITFAGQVFGVIIYAGVIFLLYLGLRNFLSSGGKDISEYLRMPEADLAAELKTTFFTNQDLSRSLSGTTSGSIVIHSDDELNIIYYNGKQVGINTTGREYQFYGVSVNQPEITAVHDMTFPYTGKAQEADNMLAGSSTSHFYYSNKNNDCLVMTVNNHSNRVVSITYYSDYDTIAKTKHLVEE